MTRATDPPSVVLELHGVRLRLTSTLPQFADYVAATMQPYVVTTDGPVDVESRLDWIDAPPARSLEAAFSGASWQRRPDRDLYLDGERLYWLRIDDFTDLHLSAAWTDGSLSVGGRYYFQIGRSPKMEWIRRLRHRGNLETLRARRFSTLLYYLVYHPILWRLGRFDGWSVVHGGAVDTPDGALVFLGMPGCGKSTLSVGLLADPQRTMLSDNIVLFNRDHVLACPEVLLLDSTSLERAAAGAARLVRTGERRVYDREAYRPDTVKMEPCRPRAFFCVERAQTTKLEKIAVDECARFARAGNRLAKEVRRIAINSEVYDLLAATSAPDAGADLEQLLKTAPCYRLAVGQGDSLENVIASTIDAELASNAAPGGSGAVAG
jgi:hypothetical protein